MQSSEEILSALQTALTSELTAIVQYMLHSEMTKNWGYGKLSQKQRMESISEMKHAEAIMERMVFLEGLPIVNPKLEPKIGLNVPEMLKNDLAAEYEAIETYNQIIRLATEQGDNGTRSLFEGFVREEEEHADWLEGQLTLIVDMGIGNFLSTQV